MNSSLMFPRLRPATGITQLTCDTFASGAVAGGTSPFSVTVDAAYVRRRLEPLVKSQDLSRFIL